MFKPRKVNNSNKRKELLTKNISLFILILTLFTSCSNHAKNHDPVLGKHPGKPEATIDQNLITLSNIALKVEWSVKQGAINLQSVTNYYDGEIIEFDDIILFAIELENGHQLTNRDFYIQNEPALKPIAATDSLPTAALRYAGKEISVFLTDKEAKLRLKWTAQLRDKSNYIRQNIEIEVMKEPVNITKLTFFDGKLPGAEMAGSVLGSPIEYKNFFFGMEHPTAHSKALKTRKIAGIRQKLIDVSGIIDGPGEYVISVVHGGGSKNFNVESITLLENSKVCDIDKHRLNGEGGNSFYHLELEDYNPSNIYQVQPEISNIEKSSGTFHMHQNIDNLLNFYVVRNNLIQPGEKVSEWAVIGVAPENQKRRAFHYYLERERARPYKQFLHYNCWWDITNDGASSFTSEQLIERMHAWNKKFIEPFDVELNSFVFDDGWDNLDSVWYFDPVKFPNGFAPQAELCKKYNSGIGVWMSPFGGYLQNKYRRVQSAHREGLETNSVGLSLAGPNYYNRFLERSLDMLNNYEVNYFKYDGFGGSNPQFLPDMEAGASLISTLRQHNPDVYINITVGSWPSPFWLKYADCTWRGSGDLHMAGEGSRTQQFMTYRDGTLYNNIVKKAPYYPLNSIMTVGIAYANLGHPVKCINDSINDFSDMVWSYFASGSSLQELYISHDRMKTEFWPILAKAAKWSKDNEGVLVDTHWIGGSPINLEVYGWASWSPAKGIIALRNPSGKNKTFVLNLNKTLELPPDFSGKYLATPIYSSANNAIVLNNNDNIKIEIKPYETRVYEVSKIN